MDASEILIKLKDEAAAAAIRIFYEEVDKGNISIEGKMLEFDDASDSLSRDMFLIGNLLKSKHEFEMLQENGAVSQGGRTAKFNEAVSELEKLFGIVEGLQDWDSDVGRAIASSSIEDAFINTITSKPERISILASLLSDSYISKEALDPDEWIILERVLIKCGNSLLK
jgi:hypothetical protein